MDTLASNIQAEQSVLASILVYNDALLNVLETLEADDFYIEKHKNLFRAMTCLYTSSRPIDEITLMEFFKQDLTPVGGFSYISELLKGGIKNSSEYVRIMKEKSNLRKLQKLLYEGLEASKEKSFDELLSDIQSRALGMSQMETSSYLDDTKIMMMTINMIEKNYQAGGGILGFKSGLTMIDRAINGFQKKKLYVVAGRPGMGKSALALNLCQNMSKDCKIDYYSLEMPEEELGIRRLAMTTGINGNKIERGSLTDGEWMKVTETMSEISKGKCYTNCKPGIHINEILSRAKKRKLQEGLDLIVVDHIGYMNYKGLGDTLREQTSNLCLRFKNMAKELEIPIIILAELSRAVELRMDKRPQLSDLKESGGIEENADVVMLLYRDEYYNKDTKSKNIIECNIAKQRSGKTGTIKLRWNGECQRVGDL